MKKSCILLLFVVWSSLSAQIKVACIGDSITEGWNGNPSYVPTLQNLLGINFIVENYGRSGATLLKNGNVPYWNQAAFRKALLANADIITIMLGTNDTKSKNWDNHSNEFKSDYLALIDTLQATNKKAKIFLVLPVPVCKDNYGIRNKVLQLEIPIIKKIARKKHLTVVDANTPLFSSCNSFEDGVHPKQAGADKLAYVLFENIKSAK